MAAATARDMDLSPCDEALKYALGGVHARVASATSQPHSRPPREPRVQPVIYIGEQYNKMNMGGVHAYRSKHQATQIRASCGRHFRLISSCCECALVKVLPTTRTRTHTHTFAMINTPRAVACCSAFTCAHAHAHTIDPPLHSTRCCDAAMHAHASSSWRHALPAGLIR